MEVTFCSSLYILIATLLLVIFMIFKPLIHLIFLKIKFGKRAYLRFIPILGNLYDLTKGQRTYKDAMHILKNIATENPEVQLILTNILHKPFIMVVDPEYQKLMYMNHQFYDKYDFFGYLRFLI